LEPTKPQRAVETQSHRWLIATFSPVTKWDGRTIAYDGETFTLDGDQPLDALTVQEYGDQGFLLWASPDAFTLVEEAAARELAVARERAVGQGSTADAAPLAGPETAGSPAPSEAPSLPAKRRRRSVTAVLGIGALVPAIMLVTGVVRLHPSSPATAQASSAGPSATVGARPAARVPPHTGPLPTTPTPASRGSSPSP